MLNLKKTAVAVLALGSSAVFAGTMGPVCAPVAVTVPCESTAWDFGVRALYLQHRGHDVNGYYSTNVNGTTYNQDAFDTDWDWGFMLEASYHFSNGNDINVNWYHYDETTDWNTTGFTLVTPFASPVGAYRYSLNPNWDAVNFEFGQTANFGEHKVIRFHGGLQYAHIEREHRYDLVSTTDTTITTRGRFFEKDEEFNGVGPRVGMDMAYHFGNGFAIYANGATALLVGENKHHIRYNPTTAFSYYNHTRDVVVPELEAKVGAMYSYATGSGEFTLDAGWMVVNYFSALRTAGTSSASFSNTHETDFSLNGPYFGAKWVGNIA